MEGLIFFLTFWGCAIAAAHYLGKTRNRTGWLWGFFLGWLGVLILLCMGKTEPAAAPTLTATELQVRELEAQVRIQELQRQLQQSN